MFSRNNLTAKAVPFTHTSPVRLTRLLLLSLFVITATAHAAGDRPQPEADAETGERPNFLLIVADDMGYSDLGAYGGEIDTPHLDQLAENGVKFSDFHVSPTCSPTRAMLLTGADSHVAGLGSMAEALQPEQRGRPGYEGYLNQSVATIAERLHDTGYFTAMVGKWHLGGAPQQIPAARGFDRSFALINGAANYFGLDQGGAYAGTLFEARYFEDDAHSRLPEGAYTTDYFTSRLIGFLDGNRQPFFAYLAFNAPHTPLQAPQDLIEKYAGIYDSGPRALRERRMQRLHSLGLIPDGAPVSPMLDFPDWASMSPAERTASSRRMQIYAAAVDRLDQNVGRVIDALRETGQLENTIIIFLSDNGAEGTGENFWLGFLQRLGLPASVADEARAANADIARVGTAESYAAYGPGWAQAGMAPFRLTKGYTTEGGIRAPLIISGPGIARARIAGSTAHVIDIVPTILDLAHVPASASVNGRRVHAPQGVSLTPDLHVKDATSGYGTRSLGWELFGRRAIRSGQWKAVYMNTPSILRISGTGAARWQLFDLDNDPGETTDLAAQKPEILQSLIEQWNTYAAENGVVLIPPLGERAAPSRPRQPAAAGAKPHP